MTKPTCREAGCDKTSSSRGLCPYHYGQAWRAGALDERGSPSQLVHKDRQHRLSQVTEVSGSRIAVCQLCGPVKLKCRQKEGRWVCPESKSGHDRRRIRATTGAVLDRRTIEREALSRIGLMACEICGVSEEDYGRRLSLDHCHSSGKVRGLLCQPCNLGLGSFRDKPEVLLAAAAYLSR